MLELTTNQEDKIKAWIKFYVLLNNSKDKIKWISNNAKKIFEMIKIYYENLNTKKSHVFTLISILKLIIKQNKISKLKNKKLNNEIIIFSEYGNMLNDTLNNVKQNNILSKTREKNYITFETIENNTRKLLRCES